MECGGQPFSDENQISMLLKMAPGDLSQTLLWQFAQYQTYDELTRSACTTLGMLCIRWGWPHSATLCVCCVLAKLCNMAWGLKVVAREWTFW